MPLYMDRHDVTGASAEETAANHASDLRIGGRFGVEFVSYWHDPAQGVVICFARAPGEDAMTQVHQASDGGLPAEIIKVGSPDEDHATDLEHSGG
jgi:hypothetical protein